MLFSEFGLLASSALPSMFAKPMTPSTELDPEETMALTTWFPTRGLTSPCFRRYCAAFVLNSFRPAARSVKIPFAVEPTAPSPSVESERARSALSTIRCARLHEFLARLFMFCSIVWNSVISESSDGEMTLMAALKARPAAFEATLLKMAISSAPLMKLKLPPYRSTPPHPAFRRGGSKATTFTLWIGVLIE